MQVTTRLTRIYTLRRWIVLGLVGVGRVQAGDDQAGGSWDNEGMGSNY